MNKRLTIMTKSGAALILDNPRNDAEARTQLMKYRLAINKLAVYEQLEQEGKIKVPLIISGEINA